MSANRPLPLRFYRSTGSLRWQTKHVGTASSKCWDQSSSSHLRPLIVLTSPESCHSTNWKWSINCLKSFSFSRKPLIRFKMTRWSLPAWWLCVCGLWDQLHELRRQTTVNWRHPYKRPWKNDYSAMNWWTLFALQQPLILVSNSIGVRWRSKTRSKLWSASRCRSHWYLSKTVVTLHLPTK